mmetsp:Transcript_4722/g.9347  ORF Transcript_4722/g.9347 Transcript_4722/m.9347 type:complete len:299 (+) Transcript_4722:455-1351(+)
MDAHIGKLLVADANTAADLPRHSRQPLDGTLRAADLALEIAVLLREAVDLGHGVVLELLPVVVLALVLGEGFGGLALQVLDLVVHLVDVHVQAVHVLEPVEVELLDLDEVRHKVLNLREARGDLQLLKRLLEGQRLLLQEVRHSLLLCKLPLALHHLLLQILLLLCCHVAHVIRQVELPLVQTVLHRVEGTHDVLELSALREELLLGRVSTMLQLLDRTCVLCPLLQPPLAFAHDLAHLVLDGHEPALVLRHELLEAASLASKLVDLLASLLVVRDLHSEPLDRQVQRVSHPLHLLCE